MNIKRINIKNKLEIVLNSSDDIFYKTEEEVFKVLGVCVKPFQQGSYEIIGTDCLLWFPIISSSSSSPKKANNYINCNGDEIEENMSRTNPNSKFYGSKTRYVFGKFKDYYKFLGVYAPKKLKIKNYVFKKIANSIAIVK